MPPFLMHPLYMLQVQEVPEVEEDHEKDKKGKGKPKGKGVFVNRGLGCTERLG